MKAGGVELWRELGAIAEQTPRLFVARFPHQIHPFYGQTAFLNTCTLGSTADHTRQSQVIRQMAGTRRRGA